MEEISAKTGVVKLENRYYEKRETRTRYLL